VTDLQILLMMAAAAVAFTAFLVLVDRVRG
jgi:hypothetical protein